MEQIAWDITDRGNRHKGDYGANLHRVEHAIREVMRRQEKRQ
jgi:hypothetical protein